MKALLAAAFEGRKEHISLLLLDKADRWAGRPRSSVLPALPEGPCTPAVTTPDSTSCHSGRQLPAHLGLPLWLSHGGRKERAPGRAILTVENTRGSGTCLGHYDTNVLLNFVLSQAFKINIFFYLLFEILGQGKAEDSGQLFCFLLF